MDSNLCADQFAKQWTEFEVRAGPCTAESGDDGGPASAWVELVDTFN